MPSLRVATASAHGPRPAARSTHFICTQHAERLRHSSVSTSQTPHLFVSPSRRAVSAVASEGPASRAAHQSSAFASSPLTGSVLLLGENETSSDSNCRRLSAIRSCFKSTLRLLLLLSARWNFTDAADKGWMAAAFIISSLRRR